MFFDFQTRTLVSIILYAWLYTNSMICVDKPKESLKTVYLSTLTNFVVVPYFWRKNRKKIEVGSFRMHDYKLTHKKNAFVFLKGIGTEKKTENLPVSSKGLFSFQPTTVFSKGPGKWKESVVTKIPMSFCDPLSSRFEFWRDRRKVMDNVYQNNLLSATVAHWFSGKAAFLLKGLEQNFFFWSEASFFCLQPKISFFSEEFSGNLRKKAMKFIRKEAHKNRSKTRCR